MKHQIVAYLLLLISNIVFAQRVKYDIKNLKLNDDKSQYGLIYHNDNKVYFTAYTVNDFGSVQRNRDGIYIFGLYEGETTADGEVINVKRFKTADNFVFNCSNASFSPDGRYMYITTNDLKRGEVYKTNEKTRNLRIERGEFVEGKGWTNFKPLPFCDERYSYGHPAVSPDGTTLYFVANIPTAKGPTDIFKVAIQGDNEYGKPENLGVLINSPRKEMYPFMSKDNVLYYASDKHGGIGGLDIYSSQLGEDGKFGPPKRLPAPINSRQDDFGYILNDDGTEGYFSSNRAGGKGDDDIYFFRILKE